ncbi:MAG: hypothetical protein WD335_02010 [Candidatus Paceibacterota bacterium]
MKIEKELSLAKTYRAIFLILFVVSAIFAIFVFSIEGVNSEFFLGPFALSILTGFMIKFMSRVVSDVKKRMKAKSTENA